MLLVYAVTGPEKAAYRSTTICKMSTTAPDNCGCVGASVSQLAGKQVRCHSRQLTCHTLECACCAQRADIILLFQRSCLTDPITRQQQHTSEVPGKVYGNTNAGTESNVVLAPGPVAGRFNCVHWALHSSAPPVTYSTGSVDDLSTGIADILSQEPRIQAAMQCS